MIERLEQLKKEVIVKPTGFYTRNTLLARGFRRYTMEEFLDNDNVIARAYAIRSLFLDVPKHIYENDLIAGSVRGLIAESLPEDPVAGEISPSRADKIVKSFGSRGFWAGYDHYAPNYAHFIPRGVPGILEDIRTSMQTHTEKDEQSFLRAAEISMTAFRDMILQYADLAERQGNGDVAATCRAITERAPETFREALQLMWLCHVAFVYEGRYAMAIGRMDQFLYPFYEKDIAAGRLTEEEALALVSCTLYKIREAWYFGGDDVVNVAIGGVKRDGSDAVNDLSYIILEAVRICDIPGPNLSARLHAGAPDKFLDECLKVVGSGLGYPAMMNDEINIPALARHGYSIEDARDYCMVGCIENFIPGKQPPWSDGRYNSPKYIELALNNGACMLNGEQLGPKTGEPDTITSMDQFMKVLEKQMHFGAMNYVTEFRNEGDRLNPKNYQQPFLSCFCDDCIGRAKDINCGGAIYPSVHGACCMGIGTMSDSLAAIEQVVFEEKKLTLTELRDILKANFEGYEEERQMLLDVPKYGNDCDKTDKYAIWFVEYQNGLFEKYHTYDGGDFYTAIASNISNIYAGKEIAATPDGRKAYEPLSDAASPMHGMDHNGPTAVVNSCTKPDYRLVSCGTVLNQKYGPEMFTDPVKRAKLLAMIRTYFKKGGQEIQINSISRDVLIDAMENPDNYRNLVVRVSGFSAYYVLLAREVQEDILKRTEHD